ncbi:tubulin-like doman-containing protein [Candidatus Venteria ishoeyi]|uniref:tubulin-like doman-containing protein n=1 Tax=Candidatus Venteria ishoeyi TaxID=1899563 RepID=UPI0025A5E3BC|nr:tubulin-like doman-containing protein [Candidatus Venteria ishoeyi]MDM8547331.1 tubulin-like doman-containing protein [Candidatus Venteria ishoeyi]
MSNHLIIGLGGTGGKIIRALRKIIFQEFREADPEALDIGYLYIDSDRSMMKANDPSWKILGNQVQLGKNSQVSIEGADLQNYLDNINEYPGIKDWIGDKEQWHHILRSFANGAVVGSQKRRLGRFLLACNIKKFINSLQLQVNQLRHSGNADVTFHICCGLAGGTGSGSIIDILTQIRKLYPSTGTSYKVTVQTPKENIVYQNNLCNSIKHNHSGSHIAYDSQ